MVVSITFPSIITTIISHKTHHGKVATNSDVKVQTMNSLDTQQPIFLAPNNFNSTYSTESK